MAAPTGLGVSPTIRVRVPKQIETAMRVVAAMEQSTISAVARDAIVAVYGGLVDDLAITTELQRRKAELIGGGEQ